MKHIYLLGTAVLFPLWLSAQITFQISITNVSCNGGGNGAAHVTAQGGVEPYAYAWSSGQQLPSIFNLSAGSYTVTVTDNTGSTASKTVSITQPPPINATLNGQPQICDQAPDGFSYAIPSGGTPPYSYLWNNGVTTQLNNHLTAGSYSVTVTDIRGCTATKTYTVNYMGAGLYLFIDGEKATCPESDNGMAVVTPASGTSPYDIQWSNGATSDTIKHITPGLYVVTVTDMNGCSATSTYTVEQEPIDPIYIQLNEYQCIGSEYMFEAESAYTHFNWVLGDPQDVIISGQDKRQVVVEWGTAGAKQLAVEMTDSTTQCSAVKYIQLNVAACAVNTRQPEPLEQVAVSPNPFTHEIRLEVAADQYPEIGVRLLNAQGLTILAETLTDKQQTLAAGHLPPGFYYLTLTAGETFRTWKMVKQE